MAGLPTPAVRVRRTCAALFVSACVLLALPSIAAACTRAERADSVAATRAVVALRASGSAGAADAAGVVARARRSCADLRSARAIAQSYRIGMPGEGQRRRVAGIDLVGVRSGGAVRWRLDIVRLAGRLAAAPSEGSAAALRRLVLASSSGAGARVWGDDPTRPAWNAARQSAVAVALARSSRGAERRLAGASVRAFAPRGRLVQLARLPLLDHLTAANRVSLAAVRSGDGSALVVARAVGARTFIRVRGARARSWSRTDGHWSSAAEHRALVTGTGALAARFPTAANTALATALRATLTTPTGIDFGALPVAEFYPWPRDAAFDTQAVTIDIDKPSSLQLVVYAEDERVVRTLAVTAEPGVATLTWDGNDDAGTTLGAGDYRYAITATDAVGNAVRVPGLEQFRIARDTVAPTVRTGTVRSVTAGGVRRLVVAWDVEEIHSPNVRSFLLLQLGSAPARSIPLHASLRAATVRRLFDGAPGTYRATLVFIDGSGNRASHAAGSIVVR